MNQAYGETPLADAALLYSLGWLEPAEMDAFESHLLAGDAEYLREFERVRPVVDALTGLVESVPPELIQRSDLINALGLKKAVPPFSQERAPDPFASDPKAMVLLRAGAIDWQPLPTPGASMKNLYVDSERRRATVLIKLEPGTVFPDHDHPDVEECLVLEGDLELGGKVMTRFDYMRIPKGGQHGTPRTRSGCIVLVTCGIAA